MRLQTWLSGPRTRLDAVPGVTDGILSTLTLTAGRLFGPEGGVTVGLATRVAAAVSFTKVFIFFVAHYAELRAELMHTEWQLNFTVHGRLAASALGRQIAREAAAGATVAGPCSLAGAIVPPLLTLAAPGPRWVGLALTLAVLAILGVVLASSLHVSRLSRSVGIMAGGLAMTLVGYHLRITS